MSTSHHPSHSAAATNEGSGEGSKLALLAALGLLVGYGSYRLSKSLMLKQRRPDPKEEEEKKAADSRDQKHMEKLKRIEI
jgi:hypothetical protein